MKTNEFGSEGFNHVRLFHDIKILNKTKAGQSTNCNDYWMGRIESFKIKYVYTTYVDYTRYVDYTTYVDYW